MKQNNIITYLNEVLDNMPPDWLGLTTHRLDIYNEQLAKTQFLDQFEVLFNESNAETSALSVLPTAYDYIRLGHPLSCILEWTIAKLNGLKAENVISFSSNTMPVLAILRTNLLAGKHTHIFHDNDLPASFDADLLRKVYGYQFDVHSLDDAASVAELQSSNTEGSSDDQHQRSAVKIYISEQSELRQFELNEQIDFYLSLHAHAGSVLLINGDRNEHYISDIQHVRRRETVAMTPANSLATLKSLINKSSLEERDSKVGENKALVLDSIKDITGSSTKALLGSSGLSVQYAIMMGLIHDAIENYPGKAIKLVVPPNCYGGTNDQARRVAACLDNVEIVDLPVDGDNDMVQSIHAVLTKIAKEDAIPYIIAEIPTNPRVEVPDLQKLKAALSEERKTATGEVAVDPVFILDQTFCPNVHFLGEGEILSTIRTISYASGSKFPSGGKCTAGYCVGNTKTNGLMEKIDLHLRLCDNEATDLQVEILAQQLPSMNQRINEAYKNTREYVNFIHEALPTAKINFVSEELASQGFTPSVFSLDLPTKGETAVEKEAYKRELNHKLINMMITKIPDESKYCVSYGQLKGCYWTIPATSTQGTTKEGDKDYIARVSLSPDMDMELHKKVFMDFVAEI